jgi:glycine/D-amino acid oxidase-like deaminating enzyme
MDQRVDVIVVGDGVLGLSIAFALADSPGGPRVALVGRPGPGASAAAGAMLSVLGELTGNSLRTVVSRERVELTVSAAHRWPRWRDRVRAVAGGAAGGDGFGSGTFLLLNGASSTLDDESFGVVEAFASQRGLPVEAVDPADIPAYRPFDADRAIRALFLPDERFLDARQWLAVLESALTGLGNVSVYRDDEPLPQSHGDGFVVVAGGARIVAEKVVVAAGAWTPRVVAALCPDVVLMPVVSGAGVGLRVRTPVPFRAVVRTPNRAFACGLHAVPQADDSVYLGATNNPEFEPQHAPTLSNLHHLSTFVVEQFHQDLATASMLHGHVGNRPITMDGYPMLGETRAPGLWVATGTYREGIHTSPVIAEEIAAGVLTGMSALPAQFVPDRDPLIEWEITDAVREAARHRHALAVEHRMRPPIIGQWPQWLGQMYHDGVARAYAALPDGFVLPPELAPLAYEEPGRLAAVIAHYRAHRLALSRRIAQPG